MRSGNVSWGGFPHAEVRTSSQPADFTPAVQDWWPHTDRNLDSAPKKILELLKRMGASEAQKENTFLLFSFAFCLRVD